MKSAEGSGSHQPCMLKATTCSRLGTHGAAAVAAASQVGFRRFAATFALLRVCRAG